MRKLFNLMAVGVFSASVAAFEVSPFIVNGSDASIADYPSFASLYYRNGPIYSSSPFCGATMINSDYALTAAHCVYGDESQMLYTVVVPQLEDKSNFLSTQQARAVEFYYPDSYIDSSFVLWPDDIAIIKLESSLAVSDYSRLLNTTENNSFAEVSGYMAVGHGFTNGNVPSGNLLQETSLTFVNNSSCRSIYGSNITNSHLCFSGVINAGYRNSTCDGDSGGPVYWFNGVEYIQIGITSFGPATCGDTSVSVTSVFTDVHDYQSWINRVINGLETPKAYIAQVDGIRTLINNDTGRSFVSQMNSGAESGGALTHLGIFVLSLLAWARRKD